MNDVPCRSAYFAEPTLIATPSRRLLDPKILSKWRWGSALWVRPVRDLMRAVTLPPVDGDQLLSIDRPWASQTLVLRFADNGPLPTSYLYGATRPAWYLPTAKYPPIHCIEPGFPMLLSRVMFVRGAASVWKIGDRSRCHRRDRQRRGRRCRRRRSSSSRTCWDRYKALASPVASA